MRHEPWSGFPDPDDDTDGARCACGTFIPCRRCPEDAPLAAENGRRGDETPAPALGDPHAENGPQIALTPREVAQVEEDIEMVPLTPGEYRVDPSIEEKYGPLLDYLNRPARRDPLTRLLRRRDGSPSWLAWAWIGVRGWGR